MPPRELNPAIPPALEARRAARAGEGPGAAVRRRRRVHRGAARPRDARRRGRGRRRRAPIEEILEEDDRQARRWWLWLLDPARAGGDRVRRLPAAHAEAGRRARTWSAAESATASQILQNKGFEVQQNHVESAPTSPRDQVVAQNPRPGDDRRRGLDRDDQRLRRARARWRSRPSPACAASEAEDAAARGAGFESKVEQGVLRRRRERPRDRARRRRPARSSSAARTVTLRVSKGPEQVEVPDVAGETEDNARSAIEGAGLRVGKVTEEESEEEPGTVHRPEPGGRASSVAQELGGRPDGGQGRRGPRRGRRDRGRRDAARSRTPASRSACATARSRPPTRTASCSSRAPRPARSAPKGSQRDDHRRPARDRRRRRPRPRRATHGGP